MVEQEPGPPGVLGSAEIWRPSSDADPEKEILIRSKFPRERTGKILGLLEEAGLLVKMLKI